MVTRLRRAYLSVDELLYENGTQSTQGLLPKPEVMTGPCAPWGLLRSNHHPIAPLLFLSFSHCHSHDNLIPTITTTTIMPPAELSPELWLMIAHHVRDLTSGPKAASQYDQQQDLLNMMKASKVSRLA